MTEETSPSAPGVPAGPRSGAQSGRGSRGPRCRDWDRGKGDAGGDAGEGAAARPERLPWVPCRGASRSPALTFTSGQSRPFSPPALEATRGSAGTLCSGRVAALRAFAISRVQPDSGLIPSKRLRSEVLPRPHVRRGYFRVHLCHPGLEFWRWRRGSSPYSSFRPGAKGAAGSR